MGGIAGIQSPTQTPADPARLTALARALAHRGVDAIPVSTSAGTSLLHAMPGAKPPCAAPGERVAVVDGLGADALPALAKLSCDVLAEAEGPPVATPMLQDYGRTGYAAAMHDPATGRLLLTRDPSGVRPLYYAETAHGFVFASEPAALARAGLVRAEVSPERALELTQLQFTTGTETLWRGINRVLPGETVIAEQGRVIARRRSGALPEAATSAESEDALLDRLEVVLVEALGRALSDGRRFGLLFSGTIEAIALAAGLRKLGRRDVQLLGVLPGESGSDEHKTQRARLGGLVQVCGLSVEWLNVTARDFWAVLPKVVARLDDPGADYTAVPLSLLAAHAAPGLDTILVPEGGAELFASHGRYRSVLRPLWLGGRSMRSRGFLEGLGVLRDTTSAWRDGLRAAESRLAQRGYTRLQAAQMLDCLFWLPNDRFSVLDRCFAAQGLEPRAPYLDRALARFAFALPDRLKVLGGRGGLLLRRWLARSCPESEPFAKHKPASFPAISWIARDAAYLGPLVAANAGVADLCDPKAVERLFARLFAHPSKRLGHAAWQLLFLALWHVAHIQGKGTDGDVFAVLGP